MKFHDNRLEAIRLMPVKYFPVSINCKFENVEISFGNGLIFGIG